MHLTQDLGNPAGMFYADFSCMNEEDVMYSQRNVCGKRFSIHAEQLLIFKWNLCIMQVSPHRRYVCVFKAEI